MALGRRAIAKSRMPLYLLDVLVMRHGPRNAIRLTLPVLSLIALTISTLTADEPASNGKVEVARQIRQAIEQLQAVRQQQRRAGDQYRAKLERVQQQVDALAKQLSEREAHVKTERAEIAELKAKVAADHATAAAARAWVTAVARLAKPVAENMRLRIQGSAGPGREQRLTAMAETIRLLDASQDAGQQLEGLRAMLGQLGEQLLAASTVTLSNTPVSLEAGQRSEHAWVVGFGLATKVFVSEDERVVGIWSGDPDSPWKLDLPEETRSQLIQLVRVVREKRPPAVVPLPVLLAPSNAVAERGATGR